MYKIELYEDSTLEGILESFKNLNECGIESFIEINGIKIFGSDPNLKEKITKIFRANNENIENNENSTKDLIEKEYTIEEKEKIRKLLKKKNEYWKLSQNEVFKYYLNVSLKYTKKEYRDKLKKYYLDIYTNEQYEEIRDIHLLANILLILEYKDILIIQEKLNMLFINLTKEDIDKLDLVLIKIEKYAINGYLIPECFNRNIIDEDIKKAEKDILILKQELKNHK